MYDHAPGTPAIDRLRRQSDLLLALVERIRDIEMRKRRLLVASAAFRGLSTEIRELAADLERIASEEEALSADEAIERSNGARIEEPGRTHKRVLIVDDESTVLQMLVMMLRTFGYEGVAADDAGRAIELVREDPVGFDLVLADVRMPGMGGVELVRQLCEIAPGLPVGLMSGADLAEVNEQLPASTPVLAKPFTVASFLDFMARATAGDGPCG